MSVTPCGTSPPPYPPPLKRYNLVLAFAVAITLGLVWPAPGVACGTKVGAVRPFTVGCIVLIFFVNGLKLKTRDARDAAKEWRGLLYGVSSILFLTVLVGVWIIRGVQRL